MIFKYFHIEQLGFLNIFLNFYIKAFKFKNFVMKILVDNIHSNKKHIKVLL